jgi:hypothetical protein
MLKLLLLSWVRIVLVSVVLMSGILALWREAAHLYWPEKLDQGDLFWACVRISLIISVGLLLWSLLIQIRHLQRQMDTSKPRFSGDITGAFITTPKYWDSNGNDHYKLCDSIILLQALAWNTVQMPPMSIGKCELHLTIDGEIYVGKREPYKIVLRGVSPTEKSSCSFDGASDPFSDLMYMSKSEGSIIFIVEGLKCGEPDAKADITLILTDLSGVEHRINKMDCDLQLGRLQVMR